MYIESAIDETFQQLLNSVSSLCPTMAIPRSGGAIEEKVRIKLQDGTALMGISYKGDVEGWRARFVGFCEVTARKYGFIKEGRLFLSNDSSLSLKELEFNFEQ